MGWQARKIRSVIAQQDYTAPCTFCMYFKSAECPVSLSGCHAVAVAGSFVMLQKKLEIRAFCMRSQSLYNARPCMT